MNFVTPLHQSTKRDYLARMIDDKVHCMLKAKEYEQDYWDGDRRYGYGGYKYLPGRWKPVAQALIANYGLKAGSRVLDVGCGKGFLLYEMQLIEPGLELVGFDISVHGLASALPDLKASLFRYRAQDAYPFWRRLLRPRYLARLSAQPSDFRTQSRARRDRARRQARLRDAGELPQ